MDEQKRRNLRAESFQSNLEILQDESDRGCVIVSAAILDDILLQLLKRQLAPSLKKEKDELFEDGALSSFSARIDLAYRIGLIRSNVRATFHLIRKIRNDFAHISNALTFDNNSVKDRVLEIFNLNKSIMETFSEEMRKANIEMFKERSFADALGARKTYEYFLAAIAAFLSDAISDIEPIKPLE